MDLPTDIFRDLGELALGSRLKRLLDRNNKDISDFYHVLGIDFKAHWFTVLYLLGKRSPRTITGISSKLNISHPAVNKIVKQMTRSGLVSSAQDKEDRRRRLVYLNEKGRITLIAIKPVWDDIRRVMADVIQESGHDFLGAIEGIEILLNEKSLFNRLTERRKDQLIDEIEIIDYQLKYKKFFETLNHEWLKEYFKIEKQDKEVLSDPEGMIIKGGGQVLFARIQGRVVGTCALIKHSNDVLELAKMAVAKEYRGRFVGSKLTQVAIERARGMGMKKLFLETNPMHYRTLIFYQNFGFRKTKDKFLPSRYERARLVMELNLRKK